MVSCAMDVALLRDAVLSDIRKARGDNLPLKDIIWICVHSGIQTYGNGSACERGA